MRNTTFSRAFFAASLLALISSGATLLLLHLDIEVEWLIVSAAIAVATAAACVVLSLLRFTTPALAVSPPVQYASPSPAPVSIPQPSPDAANSNSLDNRQWMSLVEECVELFDEFDRHKASLDDSSRELAEHINSRLQEILERAGVEIIAADSNFDPRRHKSKNTISVEATGDALIAETISPGFAVGPRVLRRAHVRLIEESDK